jgi:hypothetical protein
MPHMDICQAIEKVADDVLNPMRTLRRPGHIHIRKLQTGLDECIHVPDPCTTAARNAFAGSNPG